MKYDLVIEIIILKVTINIQFIFISIDNTQNNATILHNARKYFAWKLSILILEQKKGGHHSFPAQDWILTYYRYIIGFMFYGSLITVRKQIN